MHSKMARNRKGQGAFNEAEVDHIVALIMEWIERQLDNKVG